MDSTNLQDAPPPPLGNELQIPAPSDYEMPLGAEYSPDGNETTDHGDWEDGDGDIGEDGTIPGQLTFQAPIIHEPAIEIPQDEPSQHQNTSGRVPENSSNIRTSKPRKPSKPSKTSKTSKTNNGRPPQTRPDQTQGGLRNPSSQPERENLQGQSQWNPPSQLSEGRQPEGRLDQRGGNFHAHFDDDDDEDDPAFNNSQHHLEITEGRLVGYIRVGTGMKFVCQLGPKRCGQYRLFSSAANPEWKKDIAEDKKKPGAERAYLDAGDQSLRRLKTPGSRKYYRGIAGVAYETGASMDLNQRRMPRTLIKISWTDRPGTWETRTDFRALRGKKEADQEIFDAVEHYQDLWENFRRTDPQWRPDTRGGSETPGYNPRQTREQTPRHASQAPPTRARQRTPAHDPSASNPFASQQPSRQQTPQFQRQQSPLPPQQQYQPQQYQQQQPQQFQQPFRPQQQFQQQQFQQQQQYADSNLLKHYYNVDSSYTNDFSPGY